MNLTATARLYSGTNSGTTQLSKLMYLSDIHVHPKLSSIFHVDEALVEEIAQSMRENGFYKEEPLVIWKEDKSIIDGHTRFRAAEAAGLTEVPVVEKDFDNVDEALLYAFTRQSRRRNLTASEIYQAAVAFKIPDAKYGEGRETQRVADALGVSRGTITRARKVEKDASEEVKAAVMNNEMTVGAAYETVKVPKETSTDTTFQNEEKEWDDVTEFAPPSEDEGLDEWPDVSAGPDLDPLAALSEDTGPDVSVGSSLDPLANVTTERSLPVSKHGNVSPNVSVPKVVKKINTLRNKLMKAIDLLSDVHFSDEDDPDGSSAMAQAYRLIEEVVEDLDTLSKQEEISSL
jgi:ParB/RepB/Spo0J family partition protein